MTLIESTEFYVLYLIKSVKSIEITPLPQIILLIRSLSDRVLDTHKANSIKKSDHKFYCT